VKLLRHLGFVVLDIVISLLGIGIDLERNAKRIVILSDEGIDALVKWREARSLPLHSMPLLLE
jgi:hypothetical protein